jgi:replication initiation and membrane attachment protein DnaB
MSLQEFIKTLFFEQERDTVSFDMAFDIVKDNAFGHDVTKSKNKTKRVREKHSSGLDYTNHSRRQHSSTRTRKTIPKWSQSRCKEETEPLLHIGHGKPEIIED